MKEDYIFPYDNWYLKIDDDNKDIVNNWRINIIKYAPSNCMYDYINYRGNQGLRGGPVWVGFILITTEQFKTYVLNIEPIPKEPINIDYLIDFIKNLNK